MERKFWLWGFGFALTAVILGAFGAHGLKLILTETQLESFETGVRYQMYHAFLLIIVGTIPKFHSKSILIFIVSGILLFSSSIYLLNLKDVLGLDYLKYLGPVTPLGGLLLIFGWAQLFLKSFKKN